MQGHKNQDKDSGFCSEDSKQGKGTLGIDFGDLKRTRLHSSLHPLMAFCTPLGHLLSPSSCAHPCPVTPTQPFSQTLRPGLRRLQGRMHPLSRDGPTPALASPAAPGTAGRPELGGTAGSHGPERWPRLPGPAHFRGAPPWPAVLPELWGIKAEPKVREPKDLSPAPWTTAPFHRDPKVTKVTGLGSYRGWKVTWEGGPMLHGCSPRTQVAEAEETPQAQGHPEPYSEFKTNLNKLRGKTLFQNKEFQRMEGALQDLQVREAVECSGKGGC